MYIFMSCFYIVKKSQHSNFQWFQVLSYSRTTLCFFLANLEITRELTNVCVIFISVLVLFIIKPLILPIYLMITNFKSIKLNQVYMYIFLNDKNIYSRQDALTLPFLKKIQQLRLYTLIIILMYSIVNYSNCL